MKPGSFAGFAFALLIGCHDLSLADKVGGSDGGGGNSSERGGAGGVSFTGGTSALAATSGSMSISGGSKSNGGAASGGARPTGGTFSAGGTVSGGAASGGTVTTGGTRNTGGAAIGGAFSTGGIVSTAGGIGAGGTSASFTTSLIASGGSAWSGGTSSSGGAPASGGTSAIPGSSSGTSIACPEPITKSAALLAAEPTPVDPCARVSSVIDLDTGFYAFGLTNGEIYLASVDDPKSAERVDSWNASGTPMLLPRAVVTALFAPPNNNEGTLYVGYADATATLPNPWYAATVTRGWLATTIEHPGTVLAISGCPFHSAPSHIAFNTPWITEESSTSVTVFSSANGALSTHLQISGGGGVTTVETSFGQTTWRVYVGTFDGELYQSNDLVGSIVWDDATSQLSKPVTWSRITAPGMPANWVTRIAVHPTQPQRVFAVFASRSGDAVWYSDDAGQTWVNRSEGLPTASNPPEAPPVVGASFNPYRDGAAYVVTPQTSYFTEDSGVTWHEW